MSIKTYGPMDKLIEDSGMKLNAVADQMGISTQRLYVMRINPMSMDIEQMEKFANIIGITFHEVYLMRKNFRHEVDKKETYS